MKLEKKDYILIIVIVLLSLVLLFISKNEENSEVKKSYKRLNEQSTFFTLESCANRYIKNLSEKNVNNLVKLIDKDYQDNHGINSNNIVNKLDNLNDNYTYKVKKIYYEQINSNNYRYYLYGLLQKNIINKYDYGIDYYLVININKKSNLFSIEPLTKEKYEEVQNG